MSTFVYITAPGNAVLHSQAVPHPPISRIKREARKMMKDLSDLDEILTNLKEMDSDFELRQYGISNFTASRGFTGDGIANPNSEGIEERDEGGTVLTSNNDTIIYHVQANIVKNGTVDLMKQGFEDSESDDLAERLMAALVSVVEGNAGDRRCIDQFGTSAATGFIRVDNPDGTAYVDLSVVGNGEFEVVEKSLEEFEKWKADGRKQTKCLRRLLNMFVKPLACLV